MSEVWNETVCEGLEKLIDMTKEPSWLLLEYYQLMCMWNETKEET